MTQADKPVIIKVTFDDNRELELVLIESNPPENAKE